jgi:predicted metal-dependent hydrolase
VNLGDGQQIEICIRTSSRARRLRLVSGLEGVRAVVPPNFSSSDLSEFLSSKQDWLRKTCRHFETLRLRCGTLDSASLLFLGQRYRCVVVGDLRFSATVSETLQTITFHIPDRRKVKSYQQEWYRHQTSIIVNDRLPSIAQKMGLKYNKISIKKQRSRWGSCSRKGNLNFNLVLAAAPLEVIDYVIIHELAHLVALDHSARFWTVVGQADPEFRSHRKWLSDFAPLIKLG